MADIAVETKMLIGNRPVTGDGATIKVLNPASEGIVAELAGASPAQVDAAVQAARDAFDSAVWRDPSVRRSTLLRFAQRLDADRDRLMDLLSEVS